MTHVEKYLRLKPEYARLQYRVVSPRKVCKFTGSTNMIEIPYSLIRPCRWRPELNMRFGSKIAILKYIKVLVLVQNMTCFGFSFDTENTTASLG